MVYVITTFAISNPPNPNTYNELVRHRTVGLFWKKEDAFDILHHNYGDLWEAGYYPYAVVEEVGEGLYPLKINHWFFEYHNEQEVYVEIDELWEPFGSFIG